jgi:hypothetical protein
MEKLVDEGALIRDGEIVSMGQMSLEKGES